MASGLILVDNTPLRGDFTYIGAATPRTSLDRIHSVTFRGWLPEADRAYEELTLAMEKGGKYPIEPVSFALYRYLGGFSGLLESMTYSMGRVTIEARESK